MRNGAIDAMNKPLSGFLIVAMLVIFSSGTAGLELGVEQTTLHVEKLLAIPGRLEIRTISVSQLGGVLQVDNEAILELRGGAVETIINGQPETRTMGDMWLVAAQTTVTLNVLGEAGATLRAIYLIKSQF